ncbi:MAG: MFS transporter [Chloroflexi bacterium]|nr:MFS transporter [Chloroflexota bacterium]
MRSARLSRRVAAWVTLWSPILPLLAAEFILWTGFGALLPVMPLYFTAHGVPIALLGVVIAAWPAARLVAEPVFGVLADRSARVPVMVGGLLLAAAAVGSMAIWTGPVAFVLLRALSGLGTAMYDPAARGYLTDAAPAGRRGEVFGLYAAAQNGGILLGPAIGGLGTALAGGYVFVLVFGSVMTALAALAVAIRVRERRGPHGRRFPAGGLAEFPAGPSPDLSFEAAASSVAVVGSDDARREARAPLSLRNRFILAAVLVNIAGYFGGGLYETIWALFVTDRGGGVELVGVTFATFGLTTILLSPIGGRVVDRRGPYPFIVGGLLVMVVTMALYPLVPLTILYVPLVAVEAIGFSFLGPATYAVIGRGTPDGRSSTAQGLLGSAGTIGTIVAALIAGVLAAINLAAPFFFGATVILVLLALTLATSGDSLRSMRPGNPAR